MNFGLKYLKEGSGAAAAHNFDCQKSKTFSLTVFLKTSLLGGSVRSRSGWGRLYWKHNFLISMNQDLVESG